MPLLVILKVKDGVIMIEIDKKELNTQIGLQVRAVRDKAGLTQEALAEKLDCTAQYISDLERGVTGISIPMLKMLCLKLGISSDSILFAAEPEHNLDAIADKCRALTDEQFGILLDIINKYIEALKL